MTQYDISDISNYLEEYNLSPTDILARYIKVIDEFINHSHESVSISNIQYFKHIVIKGIETITHVFRLLLLYTRNIDLAIYNIKKSVYYFIEFIGQIGDDNNDFLKLTSTDAMLFVFKKTIFEIDNTKRKEHDGTQDNKFVDIVFTLTELFVSSLKTSIEIHVHNANNEIMHAFESVREYNDALLNLSFKQNNTDNLQNSLETLVVFSDTLRSLSIVSPFDTLVTMCKKLEKSFVDKEDIIKAVLDNIDSIHTLTSKKFVNLVTITAKPMCIQ
jgi:hypothetical protein